VCALEGEYALAGDDRPESAYWSTTALGAPRPGGQNGAGAARPATRQAYQFPAFNWFRGLESDFLLDGQMVWAHLEIDMAPLNGKPNGNGAAPAPRPAPNNKRPEELPPPKPQKP
jgi:hypothetical protein